MVLQAPDEPQFLSFSPDNDIPPIDSIYISSPHRKINNETARVHYKECLYVEK